MMTRATALLALTLALAVGPEHATADARALPVDAPHDAAVKAWLAQTLPAWVSTYQHLHAHPELSLAEAETAAVAAEKLRAAGFAVHTDIGGHGVIALLDNGPGATLMIRGDMDALPVTEETGLAYASRVTATDDAGQAVGVMHACGHDVHLTNLLATAAFLAAHRELWSGTLMILAQPAEELGQGASNVIAAGAFKRLGKPDYALALHVSPELQAGRVGFIPGFAFANVDTVDITLYGRGGHGARPHQASDAVVIGAELVTALQTLVSRRLDPQDPGVVTVGSFHAGTKPNVIADRAHLQLTVRSYSDAARRVLTDGIAQLARDVCTAFQCRKPPEVAFKQNYTPALYNDPPLTSWAKQLATAVLGEQAVSDMKPTMGGEDFGRYSRALKIPTLMFRLGAVSDKAMRASRRPKAAPLPSLHSPLFAPDGARTLETGIRVMSNLALGILRKP